MAAVFSRGFERQAMNMSASINRQARGIAPEPTRARANLATVERALAAIQSVSCSCMRVKNVSNAEFCAAKTGAQFFESTTDQKKLPLPPLIYTH